jgi:hypothetical protein
MRAQALRTIDPPSISRMGPGSRASLTAAMHHYSASSSTRRFCDAEPGHGHWPPSAAGLPVLFGFAEQARVDRKVNTESIARYR